MSIGRKVALWVILASLPLSTALFGLYVVSYLTIPPLGVSFDGDSIIAYDSAIGFVPRPSSRTRIDVASGLSYHVYTDERGARLTIPGLRSPAHTDIMTIGCSFTWGHGLENQDTFAAKVAQRLGATGLNFAMGSFSTVQSLLMLRRNRDLSPKLVIYGFITDHLRRNVAKCAPSIYPFCMDVANVTWDTNDSPKISAPLTNGVKRFQLQAEAQTGILDPVTWLTHGVDVVFGRLSWRLAQTDIPDDTRQEAALAFLLDEMTHTVDKMGATLLVVYIPTDYAPPPPSLLRSIERLNVPFIDMTSTFRRSQAVPGSTSVYIAGDGHPSIAGNALIAEELFQVIQRDHLLDRRSDHEQSHAVK
jgi:hypothetical protein